MCFKNDVLIINVSLTQCSKQLTNEFQTQSSEYNHPYYYYHYYLTTSTTNKEMKTTLLHVVNGYRVRQMKVIIAYKNVDSISFSYNSLITISWYYFNLTEFSAAYFKRSIYCLVEIKCNHWSLFYLNKSYYKAYHQYYNYRDFFNIFRFKIPKKLKSISPFATKATSGTRLLYYIRTNSAAYQ